MRIGRGIFERPDAVKVAAKRHFSMGAALVTGKTFKEIPVDPLRIPGGALVLLRIIPLTIDSAPVLERA